MNINIAYAIGKAIGAVQSWEKSLKEQTAKGDAEGIEACKRFLEGSRRNLTEVLESTKQVHQWL